MAIQFAKCSGYRTVAISQNAAKEDFARKLGAHDYIDGSKQDVGKTLKSMGGAAMIVLTAPNPELVPDLLLGLAPKGILLCLAAAGPVTLDTGVMIQGGLKFICWPSGSSLDSEEAIDFAMRHGVKCLVESFSLQDANKALDHMMGGQLRFRAVLKMY